MPHTETRIPWVSPFFGAGCSSVLLSPPPPSQWVKTIVTSSFLQWLQVSCLLSIVWSRIFPAPQYQACPNLNHQHVFIQKPNASFILAIYHLFFQMMVIIIPQRPAAILVTGLEGVAYGERLAQQFEFI